jgi:hypothetical protein
MKSFLERVGLVPADLKGLLYVAVFGSAGVSQVVVVGSSLK